MIDTENMVPETDESHAAAMKSYVLALTVGEEENLRDLKPVWPKTMEDLSTIVDALVAREHDYGTCVYAMSHAALAAFHYISHQLGVTGFQASCADGDFLRMSRGYDNGFRIFDFTNLLYPQYFYRVKMPTPFDMLEDQKEYLQKKAREVLDRGTVMHPDVQEHLEWLAAGQPEGEYSRKLRSQWEEEPELEE